MDALWWLACISGVWPKFINFFLVFSRLNIPYILSEIHHPSLSSPIHAATKNPSTPPLSYVVAWLSHSVHRDSKICWLLYLTVNLQYLLYLHYLFLKNISIFDSRQHRPWMYQNITVLKGSYILRRSNRPNWNYYRGALFGNATKLSNFLSFLWHCWCWEREVGEGGRGRQKLLLCLKVNSMTSWDNWGLFLS